MTQGSVQSSTGSGGGYRDVVVQLTGSSEDEARLAMAEAVATTFGAHIIGVHLHLLPDILDIADPLGSAEVRTLLEASEREADMAFERLEMRMSRLGPSHEMHRLHGLLADVAIELAQMVRRADLFIGTRPYGDPEGRYRIEEEVLFNSGHGCLFVPPGGTPHRRFDTIVIAWDNTREAARAVAEAMPFLVRATAVRLIHVASTWDDKRDPAQELSSVASHLRRHGVYAETIIAPFAGDTGEQIEQIAHQQAADLIVMGAYGRMRLVELVFGGATRAILRHATLPVLMAH